jgi:2-keto-3-deoxy-L-rhamnonate aldolase RhmA
MSPVAPLRERLAAAVAGAAPSLRGLVVRTPHHQVLEVLAASSTPPDVVLLDLEHSAIGPDALDAMLAVAVAHGLDALVRVPSLAGPWIQLALDTGAVGVVVPHVASPVDAATAVRAAHYGDGGRGFSGSTRAGRWGTRSMDEVLTTAAATTTVIAQVEDPAALDHLDELVSVPGLDAVFVGAADLAVALGARRLDDPAATAAVDTVVAAVARTGRPLVAFAGSPAAAAGWRARGAALVLEGTDQSRLATPWT